LYILTKEDLKEYGMVEKCGEIDGTFQVKITTGFSSNDIKTFEIMGR
jgi:hypothetical protein